MAAVYAGKRSSRSEAEMIDILIAFGLGLFVGAGFGIMLIALCTVQRRDDDG